MKYLLFCALFVICLKKVSSIDTNTLLKNVETANLSNLMSVKPTNEHVTHALKNRFSKKLVYLSSNYVEWSGDNKIFETPYVITVIGSRKILEVFREYGDIIRRLKVHPHISYTAGDKNTVTVNALIEEYCSETLESLDMRGPNGLAIEFTKIFPKLTNLTLTTLSDSTINLGRIKSNLTKIFPVVRRLTLKSAKIELAGSLKFPLLKQLTVDIRANGKDDLASRTMTVRLLRDNPEIRSLKLIAASPNLLKAIVDEKLDKLEELELFGYSDTNNDISEFRFKNVKNFRFDDFFGNYQWPSNIAFDKLEELKVAETNDNPRFVDFIIQNESLNKFQVLTDSVIENRDIERLAENKISVLEMVLICADSVEENSIIKLIENNDQLVRLELDLNRSFKIFESLAEKLSKLPEWNIDVSTYQEKKITLEKKN